MIGEVLLFCLKCRGDGCHDISAIHLDCDCRAGLHGGLTCPEPKLQHRCVGYACHVVSQYSLQRRVSQQSVINLQMNTCISCMLTAICCCVSLRSGWGTWAELEEMYAVSRCVLCATVIFFLCVSVCQLVLVCPGYDCELPTPSAGANDLYLLKCH